MAADAVGAAPVWARDDVARIARPARVAKAHAALALAVPTAVAGAGVLAAVGAAPAWLAHARAFDARAVRCGQRRSVAAAVAPVDVAEADVDHAVGWLEAGSAAAHAFVAVRVAGAAHVVAGVALASRLLHDRRRRRGPRWRRQREGGAWSASMLRQMRNGPRAFFFCASVSKLGQLCAWWRFSNTCTLV